MKLKLIIITQWFDPEPTSKGLFFAHGLLKEGFNVEVITGFPNYPRGKIYPEYKIKFIQKETRGGVNIIRLPIYPSHGKSSIGRILNYLSFSLSLLVYGPFVMKEPDIIYAYHPPLTVGLVVSIISKFRRIPVVYDIQDIWPDTLKATGVVSNHFVLNIISSACAFVYKSVSYIVVLSHGFKLLLIKRGVPSNKIEVIYNWAHESHIFSTGLPNPDNFPSDDHFKILFAGNIGKAQALETIIDAAYMIKSELPHICFILLGDGVEVKTLKKYASQKGANNVRFIPAVPMSKINIYLQSADVLLVHLRADPLFRITIPSKTQAYMAAGKPILMAVDGEASKLIEKANCGLVAKSEDVNDIVSVVKKFAKLKKNDLDILGQNGKHYYQSNFSFKHGVKHFSKVFMSLSKKSRPS